MANSAASILAKGQAIIKEQYNEPEQRRKQPTVMELALRNQDYSFPDAQALRTSPLRPVEVYFRKDIAAGSATAKAYNHTGTFGDTGATTITYVQHVETFGVPYKIGANNVYTYQDQYANSLYMAIKNLKTRHDNSALSFLSTAKAQLSAAVMNPQLAAAGLSGQWNDTTYALELTDEQKSLFVQKIKDAMASRFYGGELDVVGDIVSSSRFLNYMNQGAGNFANTSYQFEGMQFARTQSQIDSNYSAGAVYAMPKGLLAGLNWNEQLNRTGLPNAQLMNNIGQVGIMKDPLGSGALFDVSMYVQRADTSANTTGGSTQDFVLQSEITLTIGYATAPLSTAGDSPIMEIGQLAA